MHKFRIGTQTLIHTHHYHYGHLQPLPIISLDLHSQVPHLQVHGILIALIPLQIHLGIQLIVRVETVVQDRAKVD